MAFQKMLMASATLAVLTITGCASMQDQRHEEFAKIMIVDTDHHWVSDNADINMMGNKVFIMKTTDGEMSHMGQNMEIEIIQGDDGSKKYILNGKEISEKEFKVSGFHMLGADDKDHSIFLKRHALHKGDLKKHMRKMEHQHADIEHVRAMVKRMKIDTDGKSGDKKPHFIIMSDTMKVSDMGEFPRTIDLDNDIQVFIEKGGHVRIMKHGKTIHDDQGNIKIDKKVTIEDGKRKTRVIIDLIDDE